MEETGSLRPLDDVELAREAARASAAVAGEIGKVIVGQKRVIELLLVALFSRGHGLFIGVPGLAKTLLIRTLAEVLHLDFKRVQFTPDLMPSDITGTEILAEDPVTGRRSFQFVRGPIFANILLADEINRTSPKTQAALLQAMQEFKVSVSGVDHPLPLPFLVFATQNPIEQEGTYPLPEAQLDRFMFSIEMEYPSADEELEIVRKTTGGAPPALAKVLEPDFLRLVQDLVPRVPVADAALEYAVRLVRATRPGPTAPKAAQEWVAWGAGPRAAQHLVLGAKARALLSGRFAAGLEDVRSLALPALKHRIVPNFRAEARGIGPGEILTEVSEALPGFSGA
ncbi:MAG: MoxR family ATPase [Deltaproteobacteria bacterium]|nr:MoxR family ATPase [Deltaproteobacteria bacterium]